MDSPLVSRIARNDHIQARLLAAAGLFVCLYAAALTISPAVQTRNPSAALLWEHWIGVAVWITVFMIAHRQSVRLLPGRDAFLLPAAGLLSGWGMLTVWSIQPQLGLRQALWLAISGAALVAGFRLPGDLRFLWRYKYVWLTGSLALTALTLLFGVNPLGYGPRMWLGCCGIYFQPSEPLKLLLIAYMAAYMADRRSLINLADHLNQTNQTGEASAESARRWIAPLLPLIAPTLVMTGLAVALLGIQRDLGTAAIILFLYAAIVYVTSRRRRVLLFAGLGVLASGVLGYLAFDVVRVRVDAWLNPWADPSGRSYQIVQAVLAVANGGIFGRGPGLGSPDLVPVAHSDLIFATIAEQTGLIGMMGMLVLIALIAGRGLLIALRSPDHYRRYLATGLTAYLAGQSLLIIGGTLRLFPLTGVTLPFVSYGGSSLLVSHFSVLLLLLISFTVQMPPEETTVVEPDSPQPSLHVGLALGGVILMASLAAGWWSVYRSPDLLTRTDNPRRWVSDQYVRRGSILDRSGMPINASSGEAGHYSRQTLYPALSNIVGYTSLTYGQSGLEASLDPYLRGIQGNPFLQILWNNLVYGQPPPGLDVRLSLDLNLQRQADQLLGERRGALVLINAHTGEILAMASHPSFDSNRLDEEWQGLVNDPAAPLLDRATLGRYPIGRLESLFPGDVAGLGVAPTPRLRLPTGDSPNSAPQTSDGVLIYSPLQMALAAATISNGGERPAPQLVTAANLPREGWTPLPALARPKKALTPEAARKAAETLAPEGWDFWQAFAVVDKGSFQPGSNQTGGNQAITWYLGGSMPDSSGPEASGNRLAIAVVLESNAPLLAQQIGQAFLAGTP